MNMTVLNRSNDIHWGLYAVNIPTFGLLQEYIAARLGCRMGKQAHLSNSLHVYTDDKIASGITTRMLTAFQHDYPEHWNAFPHLDGEHSFWAELCSEVLEGRGFQSFSFLNFAAVFLTMYRERDWRPGLLDQRYADWIAAGSMFVEQMWKPTRKQ